jgi:hypothetical protein
LATRKPRYSLLSKQSGIFPPDRDFYDRYFAGQTPPKNRPNFLTFDKEAFS